MERPIHSRNIYSLNENECLCNSNNFFAPGVRRSSACHRRPRSPPPGLRLFRRLLKNIFIAPRSIGNPSAESVVEMLFSASRWLGAHSSSWRTGVIAGNPVHAVYRESVCVRAHAHRGRARTVQSDRTSAKPAAVVVNQDANFPALESLRSDTHTFD